MSSSTPLTLQRLPLFPLETVLFPGGWLPLRIFEVRYLDMIRRCHDVQAPFGVVCLTSGSEVETASGRASGPERFHSVGTLAHIEHLAQPQQGMLNVQCRGQQRFQIDHAEKLKHGLWVADVTLLDHDLAAPVVGELSGTANHLQQLLRKLATQDVDSAQLPLQPPYAWNDAGWVANRWAELLPLPTSTKQRLMAMDSPMVRLELVSDLLEQLRIDSAR